MSSLRPWLEQNPAFVLFAAGLLGLVVGSFLNVVIHRLPQMLERAWARQYSEFAGQHDETHPPEQAFNLVTPRSRCPHCGHTITALQNIPIVSFLLLRGKCTACGQSISWRYPIVELSTGILSVIVIWHFGPSAAGFAALGLTWTLIALAVIDFDKQILPDVVTLPLIWVGLLLNLYLDPLFTPLRSAVIGAIAGYLSLWAVFHIFRLLTGKEGMGYGDFKLFAAFGAWLGWQDLPLIILLASLVGAVTGITAIIVLGRDRHLPIPFGPFLCAAAWIALLYGNDIKDYYLQFARISV
jgi:leader peptidase (prepilin peptidase)/N-methyltransferase